MSRTIKGTGSASGRRHWSEEVARRWVEAWLESGQTQADFARKHDIHVERLARWARRLTGPAEAPDDWVARIRGGDADAFAALFRAYYSPLCVFVEGYLGSADATKEL